MNVQKCEACWIGRSKGDIDKPVKCKWISLTNNTIKILETHFSYYRRGVLNFSPFAGKENEFL